MESRFNNGKTERINYIIKEILMRQKLEKKFNEIRKIKNKIEDPTENKNIYREF